MNHPYRSPFRRLTSWILAMAAVSWSKTVLVYDPWNGTVPGEVPVAFVNGQPAGVATVASAHRCGWYQLNSSILPTRILYRSSGTSLPYGAGGSGSSTDIDLSFFAGKDTVWIRTLAGKATPTPTDPGVSGICADTARSHRMSGVGRCDLHSDSLSGSTGCLDLAKLSGTTLRVPAATTRISTDGLVVCGRGELTVPGTDIVYIIDQSGSMTAFKTSQYIVVHGADTINFKGCDDWKLPDGTKYPASVPTKVAYQGYPVQLLDPSAYDSAMRRCTPSGDPYQVRASVVRSAISQQARLAPTSQAAWIGFGGTYHSSELVGLGDSAARASLLASVVRENLDNTKYAGPIGWARALLQGATSGSKSLPASPNRRKAIILVSDGAPDDLSAATAMLKAGAAVTAPSIPGGTWTLPSQVSPPIYGFMLSTDSSQGSALKQLAAASGGAYYLIPPLDKDSLERVMEKLLGLLVDKGVPDSLRIRNLSNGQVARAVAGPKEGAGYRFRLDSLVGLEPGPNLLELREVLHGPAGDSTATVRWTIDVTDSGADILPGGVDTVLSARCHAPTTLRVRPATDTARRFADARDTVLRFLLDVRPDGQTVFPVDFSSLRSGDPGTLGLVSRDPGAGRDSLQGAAPWVFAAGAPARSDLVVQTGWGWDTVRAVFHMARDHRDSAVGVLPVVHPWPVSLRLSPDISQGPVGRIAVTVSDRNTDSDAVSVRVFRRFGDSVHVLVRRDTGGIFRGSIPFAQGVPVVRGDSILQLEGNSLAFDTVTASYQDASDTSFVKPGYSLRFLDDAGAVHDEFRLDTLLRATVPMRIQVWSAGAPVAWTGSLRAVSPDPRIVLADSTGTPTTVFRVSAGVATLQLRSVVPLGSVGLDFALDSIHATLHAGPLSWRAQGPDSAVYEDTDGDGGLDLVRVHLHSPWNPANVFVFHWPDPSTTLDLAGASFHLTGDSLQATWRFASPRSPLATGWNGWPWPGIFSWSMSDSVHLFPVRERIAPVVVSARLAPSPSDGIPDTLVAVVSEPIDAKAGAEWLRHGRPSEVPPGAAIPRIGQEMSSVRVVRILVDSSFGAVLGDSIRLAPGRAGGAGDSAGNISGPRTRWVPLEIGPGRPRLSVEAHPAIATCTGWEVPPDEPPVSVVVRARPGDPWQSVGGQGLRQDSSHYVGILIRATRDLEVARLHLYDNTGVAVAGLDLGPVLQALHDGSVPTTLRGEIEILLAWNGRSHTGRMVPSGIYLARVFGWMRSGGRRIWVQKIHTLGWRIPGNGASR